MKYQLVLQFRAHDPADFDELVSLEEVLDQTLSEIAEVDGHDFGQGEFNIFLLTNDPVGAFKLAEPVIEARKPVPQLKAAYRDLQQEEYTLLWPPSLQHFVVS